MPGVVALSLSLISLGANAHTVSDGPAGTQTGQSVQSQRPEMDLPLPESCCIQVAQTAGQQPATPTTNPDTGKGATVNAGDELDELFKESDSALAKVASTAREELEKARAEAEKATADLAETSRRGSILEYNMKMTEEILNKCTNTMININEQEEKSAKCIQEMEEIYRDILSLRVNSSDNHRRRSIDCAIEFSIASMQFMIGSAPVFSNTTFARDGLESPFKEAFQKELSRLVDEKSKSKEDTQTAKSSFCKDLGIEED